MISIWSLLGPSGETAKYLRGQDRSYRAFVYLKKNAQHTSEARAGNRASDIEVKESSLQIIPVIGKFFHGSYSKAKHLACALPSLYSLLSPRLRLCWLTSHWSPDTGLHSPETHVHPPFQMPLRYPHGYCTMTPTSQCFKQYSPAFCLN